MLPYCCISFAVYVMCVYVGLQQTKYYSPPPAVTTKAELIKNHILNSNHTDRVVLAY